MKVKMMVKKIMMMKKMIIKIKIMKIMRMMMIFLTKMGSNMISKYILLKFSHY